MVPLSLSLFKDAEKRLLESENTLVDFDRKQYEEFLSGKVRDVDGRAMLHALNNPP